jgi:hypothetical protein
MAIFHLKIVHFGNIKIFGRNIRNDKDLRNCELNHPGIIAHLLFMAAITPNDYVIQKVTNCRFGKKCNN